MEKVINVLNFISDIIKISESIVGNSKNSISTNLLFDISYYSILLYKLTKMECYTLSYEFVTEICGKPISNNSYYIFYDLIKEDFVFLKGKTVKQLKVKNPKSNLIELINQNDSFTLDMIYIEDKLKKVPTILNKINFYDIKAIIDIVSIHYNEYKKIASTKQNNQYLLLQTSYLIGNETNKNLYQSHDKHLLLSTQLTLIQEYHSFYNDEELSTIDYIKDIKKQIVKKFSNYGLLNMTRYFHIYEYDTINEMDESFKYVYIDFEIDELVKLLLFVDVIENIDKI